MAYQDLTPDERIQVLHIDIMRDPEFSRLGAVTQIGTSTASPLVPTAATNGLHTMYSSDWLMRLDRKQARYVVAHENLHKLFEHCTAYTDIVKKNRELSGIAMDHVVNNAIEDMDNGRGFVAAPTDFKPVMDRKYKGWSWLEVLHDLKKNGEGEGGAGKGDGEGQRTFDVHEDGDAADKLQEITEEEAEKLPKMLQDAVLQGEIVSKRLRGEGGGNANLGGYVERNTDWRTPMLQFLQENCEGDELSRWCPPNRRFLPLDIVMPSHFSEAAGELVVACDTSGSMMPYYGLIFGEIGRFAQTVNPSKLTVIWWDDGVRAVQNFTTADYGDLKNKLKPVGSGGTTVSCVAQYLRAQHIKPQATIYLTDGYIESQYEVASGPVLWGVVGNPRFQPLRGKLVRIQEDL